MKFKYLTILTFATAMVSCDVLDKEPADSWESSSAITSYEDLVYAVNGVYESQTWTSATSSRGIYSGDFTLYADMKGEDFQCIGKNGKGTDVSWYLATPTSLSPETFYFSFYQSLARVNKVIEQVAEVGLSGDEVEQQLGELYALRALFHFDLARLYAKIPSTVNDMNSELGITLATQTFPANYIGERTSLAKTYETIFSDLDTALQKLANMKDKTTGHINYWGALALRSRVHLYMDNADGTDHNALALKDAKEVIENSPYKLYSIGDYLSVWSQQFTPSENIFEIAVTSQYNAQRTSLGYYTHAEGYAEAAISDSFKQLLASQPAGDVRKELIAEETDNGNNTGFYTQKYPGYNGEIYVNNPKVIRLSEVYLIAAEAALKSIDDNGVTAAKYINDLREKRITGYSDVNTVTLDEILKERRIELNGEGHMAWDMWRNKKSVNNPKVGKIDYTDYRTILPIPQAEINTSHGVIKQNFGY